jgi:hypothetical protein
MCDVCMHASLCARVPVCVCVCVCDCVWGCCKSVHVPVSRTVLIPGLVTVSLPSNGMLSV